MDVVFDSVFLKHKMEGHPECPHRLCKVMEWIKQSDIDVIPAEYGEKYLTLAHTQEYLNYVKNHKPGFLDMDTYIDEDTYSVACYGVGSAIKAAKMGAFAIIRPPGHHATRESSGGFCIFNNIGVASLWLKKRVFIIDFDAHHGNGTQDIVLGNQNIIYFSTHQSPLYPGTGLRSIDNCINITLRPGTGDDVYIKIIRKVLEPALSAFNPEYVAVSAGFDSYYKDAGMLANLKLTTKSYIEICKIIRHYRTFFVLEGGYNPMSILDGIKAVIEYL